MDIQAILKELKAERDRLEKAIAALEGRGSTRERRVTVRPVEGRRGRRARRRFSAAGQKRISEMMKRRWAERRRAAAGTTETGEGRPPKGRPRPGTRVP